MGAGQPGKSNDYKDLAHVMQAGGRP